MPMLWAYGHYKLFLLLLQCWDRLQTSETDVYRRQIMTSEVDLRAVRVNPYNGNDVYSSYQHFYLSIKKTGEFEGEKIINFARCFASICTDYEIFTHLAVLGRQRIKNSTLITLNYLCVFFLKFCVFFQF